MTNNGCWESLSIFGGETTRLLLKPPRHPVVMAIFVLPMPCGRSDQPGWDLQQSVRHPRYRMESPVQDAKPKDMALIES